MSSILAQVWVDFSQYPWTFEEHLWHHIEFDQPLAASDGLAALRTCCEPLRCEARRNATETSAGRDLKQRGDGVANMNTTHTTGVCAVP